MTDRHADGQTEMADHFLSFIPKLRIIIPATLRKLQRNLRCLIPVLGGEKTLCPSAQIAPGFIHFESAHSDCVSCVIITVVISLLLHVLSNTFALSCDRIQLRH